MNKNLEALVRKWSPLLEGLTTDSQVKNMAQLLESEERYFDGILGESGTPSTPTAGDNTQSGTGSSAGFNGIARYKKIAMPLVRRVFPELLANQLVGVQPMSGPVSLAYALRFKNDAGAELGYGVPDASYTGSHSTSGGEGLNEPSGRLGSNGSVSNEAGLSVEQKEIKARTRKMKARWSVEAQQDLAAMQNVDLEEEMMDLLAYEVQAEIDRELVGRIHNAANYGGRLTWEYGVSGNVSGTADGRWELEKFKTLWTSIVHAAEDISRATRMGAGNYVICSPRVVTALSQIPGFAQFTGVSGSVATLTNGVSLVGELNGIKIYRDTFAYDDSANDFAVVGYKGSRENDTGIIYCPYVPLMFARATGEESFSPRAGVMTRYGICDHLFGSHNYYRKIDVVGLSSAGSMGSFTRGAGVDFYDSI
jgi:hypothetical protein